MDVKVRYLGVTPDDNRIYYTPITPFDIPGGTEGGVTLPGIGDVVMTPDQGDGKPIKRCWKVVGRRFEYSNNGSHENPSILCTVDVVVREVTHTQADTLLKG